MRTIVDLHVHSKYARATSKSLDLKELSRWSKIKGVDVVACGDFTHPQYFREIRANLVSDNKGLFDLKESTDGVKFILGTEVACIYKHNGATRRLHHLLFCPDMNSVEMLNKRLTDLGKNLKADGRPILGISSRDLLEILLDINPQNVMIPAHVWTPWFAIFGSKSGYDSVAECFGDLSQYIFALETGLSSDPEMNWSLSQLDRYSLVSNSDAHSGPNIGRESNVLDLKEVSYDNIMSVIRNKDPQSFLYTIEFFPEEGMYHIDGHRSCKVALLPDSTKKYKNVCPVCKKPLTIGVLHRVDNLRDRKLGELPSRAIPFKKIIPLPQIISDFYSVGKNSKKVQKNYLEIISKSKNEFEVLLDLDRASLVKIMPAELADGILRVRAQDVELSPGYDGVYGTVKIFDKSKKKPTKQAKLF